jgi:hypothetical protein
MESSEFGLPKYENRRFLNEIAKCKVILSRDFHKMPDLANICVKSAIFRMFLRILEIR